MPEQPRHLANKYEDIVNLQHIVAASHTACLCVHNGAWRIAALQSLGATSNTLATRQAERECDC